MEVITSNASNEKPVLGAPLAPIPCTQYTVTGVVFSGGVVVGK